MPNSTVNWAKAVHGVFQDAGIGLAAYVPDGGLRTSFAIVTRTRTSAQSR